MSRLSDRLCALQQEGKHAMGIFLTSGFPTPKATGPLLDAMDAGGADFLELGMPFSDPLAEGLPIQQSSACALSHGIRMEDTFRTAEAFRARSTTPLLLMGYINPILRYGISNFCQSARSSGVDGLIIPDLPPEEALYLAHHAKIASLDLIHLVAPNTPDNRIRQIDKQSSGFVYAVSVTGLTGSGINDRMSTIETYLQRIRKLIQHNPIMVGFGIRTHADANRLCHHTDGFIVGSAIVRLIEQLWCDETLNRRDRLAEVRRFVHTLKTGGDSP